LLLERILAVTQPKRHNVVDKSVLPSDNPRRSGTSQTILDFRFFLRVGFLLVLLPRKIPFLGISVRNGMAIDSRAKIGRNSEPKLSINRADHRHMSQKSGFKMEQSRMKTFLTSQRLKDSDKITKIASEKAMAQLQSMPKHATIILL